MTHNYSLRLKSQELPDDWNDNSEDVTSTTGGMASSPFQTFLQLPEAGNHGIPFSLIPSDTLLLDDSADETFDPTTGAPTPRLFDEEKVIVVLQFMKERFPRLSLRLFLETLLRSQNPFIKNSSSIFMMGNRVQVMDLMVGGDAFMKDESLVSWLMAKAAQVCETECSHLTDHSSKGPHFQDAQFLRVPADKITVQMVQSFRLPELTSRYEHVTPRLQSFLKTVIGKPSMMDSGSRDPDAGQTLITSMMLNLRSRLTSYHVAVNALMLWDNHAPKRLIQAFNQYGICSSYPYLLKSIAGLSKDAVHCARVAANDLSKLKLFPYNNFNWISRTWEPSALHGNVSHDQVSALLLILPLPKPSSPFLVKPASHYASVERFEATEGTRHQISADQALADIVPSAQDQQEFRKNVLIHIGHILLEEIQGFSRHWRYFPLFNDSSALPACKTEEYYLPTYDQEQSSTRGNMLVLKHYFQDVLAVPESQFEKEIFFVLGDRLTTARDRAAQDQSTVQTTS